MILVVYDTGEGLVLYYGQVDAETRECLRSLNGEYINSGKLAEADEEFIANIDAETNLKPVFDGTAIAQPSFVPTERIEEIFVVGMGTIP